MAEQIWSLTDRGIALSVRLTPRGGRDAIEGVERLADGRAVLKARVRAAPFEGEANAALCRLVAGALGTAPGQVQLLAGATARVKRIQIVGDKAALVSALGRLCQAGSKPSFKLGARTGS